VRFLPVANPPNPFSSTTLDYEIEDNPGATLQVYEDHSRSILAKNDSPDVGFRWSVNPYRGCLHACAYCLSGDTPILMGDGSTRELRALRVGDEIYGTQSVGESRRYVRTRVLAHWQTVKPAYRVRTADGTELTASGDHRLLTDHGWKHVTGAEHGASRRPHLTPNDQLLGAGGFTVSVATRRTCDIEGVALQQRSEGLRVVEIEELGFDMLMYDITTGTGDFIANGVVSHNCYARPSHEYLSFGAGSDFERKIVVKPRAPELLREAFDRPSWKGELVVFSGITDCYQPLEHTMKLTRGCLEVCVEYKNPAGIITKSPVVERDAELLAELARVASCRVSVSVPFWDPAVAKAMEPYVTPPARRMKIVEALAKAGVPVGVSVSPVIPGLNDGSIPEVLEAARDAGARHAFFVMLRLPGSVRPVFEGALRDKLPLRADKVLRRLREMHGGKLYDSRFGHRGRGDGVYAEAIEALFTKTAARLGLACGEMGTYESAPTFARPDRSGQMGFGF
jgi:DNA repair photolyase